MATESRTAVYVGIGANILIAATKFAAALFTGSSAMVAEGMHSVVDAGDGSLLLFGQHQAAKPADEAHPLGHGKELYFWALIVAILFFSIGGGMSIYEGIDHVLHPEPITDPKWNYIVISASAVITLGSLVAAFVPFRKRAGSRSYWKTFRDSKDPTLFTLVLEDLADMAGLLLAFLGVYFSHRLERPYLDGLASVGIGLVLASVAVLLARESKGLLIGEGATGPERAAIQKLATGDADVRAVRRLVTMHFGPHTILVAMDVAFRADLETAAIATAVKRMEQRIKENRPDVKHIYIETVSMSEYANAGDGATAMQTA